MTESGSTRIGEVVLVVHHRRTRLKERGASLARIERWVIYASSVCSISAINFEDEFSICDPVKCAPVGVKVYYFVVPRNIVENCSS